MDPNTISIITIILLIAGSAFFSATETAFSSLNRIRIKNYAASGNKRAKRTLKIANNFDNAISTILIGNNIVNIASASLATVLFVRLIGENGVGLSTVVTTVVVLIFGEVLPKSIAKEHPEQFALAVSGVLEVLMVILTPFAWLLKKLKNLVTSRMKTTTQPSVTEEELKYIIEEIEDEGVLDEHESELMQSALDFNDITVSEILTPRVDIVGIEVGEDIETIKHIILREGYSRLPVYEKTIDNIIGVLNEKDFIKAYMHNKNVNVRSLMQKTIYVPPKKHIAELLKEIQREKMHLAVVTDQYGGTLGIISLEDIIEQLVGEIWDESDEVITNVVPIGEGVYQISADMNVYDLLDYLDIDDAKYTGASQSVSAWALEMFQKIPEANESFQFLHLTIEVLEVTEQRIKTLKVIVGEPLPEED